MAHQIGQMRLFQGATLPLRVPHQVHRPACRCTVVAKATKAADLRGLTTEDIQKQIYESKRALFDLRVAQKTRKAFKPSDFGINKNKIGQLMTILREREIAEGISKRESKRAEKKKRLDAGFGQY